MVLVEVREKFLWAEQEDSMLFGEHLVALPVSLVSRLLYQKIGIEARYFGLRL